MTLAPTTSRSTTVAFSGVRCLLGTTILNSADYITWSSVAYDTDDYENGDATPTDLVIPETAKYDIEFWIYDFAADIIGVNCVRNRAGAASNVIIASVPGANAFGATTLELVAGDTISLRYFGTSPSTLDAGAISVTRVS